MPNKRKIIIGLAIIAAITILIKTIFFDEGFLYAGTLNATKVDLSPQVQSSIAAVHVHEGDHVSAEQELITLSCEDYKVDAELANHNYQRNQRLFLRGAVTQDTLDQLLNRKQDADIRVNWCKITSPINGTVLSRYHEPGEYVSPGVKILSLANIRSIWAYIYVPQTEVAKIKPGMKLVGIVPELGNREFIGHVAKINSEAEFTPKNVQTRSERTRLVFGVKVSFLGANEDEVLKPGMTIEVRLPKE